MKVGGQILWNAIPICETSQIYCLMGRRPMKDVLGNHLKDLLFHLVHWLSITPKLRRISQESINLERKSYLDCSSDTLCTQGEFGRVTAYPPYSQVFSKAGAGAGRMTSLLMLVLFASSRKTVENRPRNGTTLVKDCEVRGAVVGMGNDDVRVEGGVECDACGGAGW